MNLLKAALLGVPMFALGTRPLPMSKLLKQAGGADDGHRYEINNVLDGKNSYKSSEDRDYMKENIDSLKSSKSNPEFKSMLEKLTQKYKENKLDSSSLDSSDEDKAPKKKVCTKEKH
jgi:hypothetical protein